MSLVLLFGGGVPPPGGDIIAIPVGALVVKGPATPVPPITSPTIAIPVRALSLQGPIPAVSHSGLRQLGTGPILLAGLSPSVSVSGAAAIVIAIDPGALDGVGHPPSVIAGPPALPPVPESWVVIQGIDRTTMLRAAQLLEIEYTLGARGVGRCEILDRDRYHDTASAYRPLVDHTISVTYHGQTLFNGNILAVDDHALIDPRLGVVTAIGAADYARVTGQRVMSFVYPAGNFLKGIVNHIVSTWLSVYNITLDPAMTDGPILGEQIFDLVSVETALNHLAAITGWVWRITPAKVLEMFAPGTKTAPFALSPLNANIRGGVTWSKARTKYVNRCYVRYGTETQVEKVDIFYDVPPGLNSYALTYPALIADRGYILVDGIHVPIGPGTNWLTTRTALIAIVAPPAGSDIEITYTAQFPLVLEYSDPAEVSSYGPFEEVVDMPDTFDIFAANEMAMAVVRSYKTTPRTLTIRTRAGFVLPGTTISISVPARLVSGEWMVTAVRIREEVDQELLYEYTCLEGLEHFTSWVDFWRQVVGQPATTKTVSGSVSGAAIPAASGSFAGPISAQGPANAWTANFLGSQTAPSYGQRIQAGTTVNDYALSVLNAAETVSLMAVRGNGVATMGTQVVANADPGDLVLKNGADLRSADAAGSTALSMVSMNTSNQVVLAGEGHDIRWGRPALATGGATGAVLGTLGSGPATPAQAGWLRVVSSTGAIVYLPFWV